MKKFFISICLAIYFLVNTTIVQKKFFYSFPYRQIIENYSSIYNVDKFLAVAVIKNESNFSESAYSPSGAIGLMQLMPETATWIAHQLREIDEVHSVDIEKMEDPETNIRYGIWYLAELEKEFHGNDILILAAYNAGRNNVWDWIEENNWDENFSDINQIPYQETREYVKRVIHTREKYSKLYIY